MFVEQIRIESPGFKKEEIKWEFVVVRFVKEGWPKSKSLVLTLFDIPINIVKGNGWKRKTAR